jgi:hypothetical protein
MKKRDVADFPSFPKRSGNGWEMGNGLLIQQYQAAIR